MAAAAAAAADKAAFDYNGVVLRESDIVTLRGPCFLNDQIISFYFSYLSSSSSCITDRILFVPPSVSFWVANTTDSCSVREILEPLDLASKNLIFFAVNNADQGGGGTHWSLMVYERSLNEFLHHDSVRGVNKFQAIELYEAVRDFVVVDDYKPPPPRHLPAAPAASKRRKRKRKNNKPMKSAAYIIDLTEEDDDDDIDSFPGFKECPTPQQRNSYDCGVYVLAIAKAVCEWYCSKPAAEVEYWYNETVVDPSSVEFFMRTEVLSLIECLSRR